MTSPSSTATTTTTTTTMTSELDAPLHALGFVYDQLSPSFVSGHLLVSSLNSQPFKVLHGGVSAMIAEGLASTGAYLACGMKRVAGIHLGIDHVKSAHIGDLVLAEATPLSIAPTIQVWEVKLWKTDTTSMEKKNLISSARVTLVCNLPVPDSAKGVSQIFHKYAKL